MTGVGLQELDGCTVRYYDRQSDNEQQDADSKPSKIFGKISIDLFHFLFSLKKPLIALRLCD